DLIDFDSRLEDVSLVVTGEGRTDWQSCFGKVMQGVGMRCKSRGIPAVALVGAMGEGAEKIFDYGICSIMTTVNGVMELDTALENAEDLYYRGAHRMFRFIKTGMEVQKKAADI
ncbi:MAG TPA: glycerate kinase, partial [Clostridium sp.]|nr:glycerate kinase [Clostridium sp.]